VPSSASARGGRRGFRFGGPGLGECPTWLVLGARGQSWPISTAPRRTLLTANYAPRQAAGAWALLGNVLRGDARTDPRQSRRIGGEPGYQIRQDPSSRVVEASSRLGRMKVSPAADDPKLTS